MRTGHPFADLTLVFYTAWKERFLLLNSSFQFRTHLAPTRKGRVPAISATARKLTVIIWNMVVKRVQYINPEGYLFMDQKRKLGIVKRIQKQIAKFELTADDLQ